ncbi:hypothetical protein HELRODRAFT_173597 [Helobdella robusta]|uniref:Nucleotide-diphospho-sugar transferase domain-containing protein n=1 Tax=Helobdella robusta TaxID=6412 RepID=T1F703_HELRO|nr:hypothetical protein HELRODRAFT_173597 [Helobdella robusta]ESO03311.1 hypothetical protein HELRODRAFT_173597 [Helobdella robusta]
MLIYNRNIFSLKFVFFASVIFVSAIFIEIKYDVLHQVKDVTKGIYLLNNFINDNDLSNMKEEMRDKMFIDAISMYAKTIPKRFSNETELKFIILAVTDNSFFDMALNLYLTSFKKFKIINFLFVGIGKTACKNFLKMNVQCFYFTETSGSNNTADFGSKQFQQKVNIRTEMILKALKADFSVLHTDVDVTFLDNPIPYIESKAMKIQNVAFQSDIISYNSGFLIIKPTNFSIELYTLTRDVANKSRSIDDQESLNLAIKVMQSKYKSNPEISSIDIFDKTKILCGKCYFEEVDRNFPTKNGSNGCPGCLVMHNNWIKTHAAKVYRFKEILLWFVDKGGYYSDRNRKYLLYNNPFFSFPPVNYTTDREELNALKTGFALAQMLNRTLIIPRFHCRGAKNPYECSLIHWINVKSFDMFFEYRENSFLSNPLVPENIRKNLSQTCPYGKNQNKNLNNLNVCTPPLKNFTTECLEPVWILIDSKKSVPYNDLIRDSYDRVVTINLKNYTQIPEQEILKKFGKCDDGVLHVVSLIGVEVTFDNITKNNEFETKIRSGFLRNGYMQL